MNDCSQLDLERIYESSALAQKRFPSTPKFLSDKRPNEARTTVYYLVSANLSELIHA